MESTNERTEVEQWSPFSEEVYISKPCWSCGVPITKLVPFKHRHHTEFVWYCETCEVNESGSASKIYNKNELP